MKMGDEKVVVGHFQVKLSRLTVLIMKVVRYG